MSKLEPITPGEILLKEFLIPMGLSQYRLAQEIGVPAQRINARLNDLVAQRLPVVDVHPRRPPQRKEGPARWFSCGIFS
jgi:hypothetical protein